MLDVFVGKLSTWYLEKLVEQQAVPLQLTH